MGALQRAKNQHPVLGASASKDLRPSLLPSLQDFFSGLDDKEEGEAGFPTKAMTQRLKPHPGEGAPRTRGQHLQACLEESGLSHMPPKAVGLSPGQEHVGMVPLPRAGATWPHITAYSLPTSPTLAHPRPATRKSQVTFQWQGEGEETVGPQENLKPLLNLSPTPKPTQCGFCGPRFR